MLAGGAADRVRAIRYRPWPPLMGSECRVGGAAGAFREQSLQSMPKLGRPECNGWPRHSFSRLNTGVCAGWAFVPPRRSAIAARPVWRPLDEGRRRQPMLRHDAIRRALGATWVIIFLTTLLLP